MCIRITGIMIMITSMTVSTTIIVNGSILVPADIVRLDNVREHREFQVVECVSERNTCATGLMPY